MSLHRALIATRPAGDDKRVDARIEPGIAVLRMSGQFEACASVHEVPSIPTLKDIGTLVLHRPARFG